MMTMNVAAATLFAAAIALPQSALAAPPNAAVGGSTQVSAQNGCMNQWMFDGVWRVRVTSVAFRPAGNEANGWDVTMQWNNGTKYEGISPIDTMKNDMQLALANGDTIAATETTAGTMNQQKLDYHSFPASGQFTYTQMFNSNNTLDPNNKPAKLLITFDAAKYKSMHPGHSGKFWNLRTLGYNYRIDLTCSK